MTVNRSELAQLLIRVGHGDKDAFGRVYAASSAKLYGIILRILKRRELADEVLQETYVNIWRSASRFDENRASPITWMATIARNKALDEVRKFKPMAGDDDAEFLNLADTAPLPGELLLQREDYQKLVACLDMLEHPKRDLVTRAYLQGQSRESLAEHFEQPIGTIKTWLHRSLKQLRECLK